jgi:hypothetical protein
MDLSTAVAPVAPKPPVAPPVPKCAPAPAPAAASCSGGKCKLEPKAPPPKAPPKKLVMSPAHTAMVVPDQAPDASAAPAVVARWKKSTRQCDWDVISGNIFGPQGEGEALLARSSQGDDASASADAEQPWWTAPPGDQAARVHAEQAAAVEREALSDPLQAWRSEWSELRLDQLRRQGQKHLAYAERTQPGQPESILATIRAFAPQISFLERHKWPRPVAEAYTLLLCCCHAALGAAIRAGRAPHSDWIVRRALHDVCHGRVEAPFAASDAAPIAYANLTGLFGLASVDSAWEALLRAGEQELTVGSSFRTGAVAAAVSGTDPFPANRGLHVRVARGGVREWQLVESDVVCFHSAAATGDTFRSLLSVGGTGHHLPPGALVTLTGVSDKFTVVASGIDGARSTQIKQRLLTVSVAFASPPEMPAQPEALVAATAELSRSVTSSTTELSSGRSTTGTESPRPEEAQQTEAEAVGQLPPAERRRAAPAPPVGQCEKDADCTRGYRHGEKGGSCSFAKGANVKRRRADADVDVTLESTPALAMSGSRQRGCDWGSLPCERPCERAEFLRDQQSPARSGDGGDSGAEEGACAEGQSTPVREQRLAAGGSGCAAAASPAISGIGSFAGSPSGYGSGSVLDEPPDEADWAAASEPAA